MRTFEGRPQRSIRILVNVGLLLLVAVVGVRGVRQWRMPAGEAGPVAAERLVLGSTVRVGNVDVSAPGRTALLFVRTTCPVCSRSLSFYKRLHDAQARDESNRLIVVSPEPLEVIEAWLASADVGIAEVRPAENLIELGIAYVPTLVITDSGGVVTDIVNRALTPEEEALALQRFETGDGAALDVAAYAPFVTESQLTSLLSSGWLLLDVRDRPSFLQAHDSVALNIPYDEVEQRAERELPVTTPVVIDCRRGRLEWCDVASEALLRQPGGEVAVLVQKR